MQGPEDPVSKDSTAFPPLEKYVKDVLKTFAQDKRILLWDLYNEPGNSGKGNSSLPLLKNIFKWAREVNPSQPISSGVWSLDLEEIGAFQAMNSDIITYHNYDNVDKHKQMVKYLKLLGRPLICTEYMARTNNSNFETVMPMLKENNVGAINWGFVAGKSNTIYAWSTPIADGSEPKIWFHDILRADGSPYKASEIKVIKDLNGVN